MPHPAYVASGASPLVPDLALGERLAVPNAVRTTVLDHVVPVRAGYAFTATAGQIVRFETVDGPQVVDLNLWSRDDPRERFWAARTRQFYGTHVTVGHRLWSNLPFLRPLATFIADTLGYGRDADDERNARDQHRWPHCRHSVQPAHRLWQRCARRTIECESCEWVRAIGRRRVSSPQGRSD